MAFNETPKIDIASKNSNESEAKLETLLNQHSGFICRKDVPDKGCDYDIELITNGTDVSGWRFALQLKSIEKLNVISGGTYISYSFETSRLGYLMRRIPAMGILALYSVERNEIFFDYVDEIYYRLMSERDSDAWKENSQVNIRIPVKNVMNVDNIRNIHKVFTNRFIQAAKMQVSNGSKYGLPTTNITGDTSYDWNNIEDIKKMLLEYGVLLLNNYDLNIIYDLISRLTHKDICTNKELIRLAAVTYCEVGKYSEAKLYNRRVLKFDDITTEGKLMSEFTDLKIRLGLGELSFEEFIKRARSISSKDKNEQNRLALEINIVFYELLSLQLNDDIPDDIGKRIKIISKNIIESNSINPVSKIMLEIWNIENLGVYINKLNYEQFAHFRMKESLGYKIPLDERKKYVLENMTRENEFMVILKEINEKVINQNNLLLSAYIQALVGRNFLSKELNLVAFKIKQKDDNHKKLLSNRITLCLRAVRIFLDHNHIKEAHTSLCNGLELIEISTRFYNYEDDFSKDDLYDLKRKIESECDMPEYEMVIVKLLENQEKRELKQNHSSNQYEFLIDMNDSQIEWFAKEILYSSYHRIDDFRLKNLINELKAYRLFALRCTNSNIEALQVFEGERTAENAFKLPTKFVLKSKATGIVTHESYDMNELLKSWDM